MKNGCVRLTINSVNANDSGTTNNAMSVMSALIDSIMTSTPITLTVLVMAWVTLWLKECPKVSTSLVMRLSVSPTGLRSKYAKGMRSIFWSMASRRS